MKVYFLKQFLLRGETLKEKAYFCLCFILVLDVLSVQADVETPGTFVLAEYGNLRTLDPCVAY